MASSSANPYDQYDDDAVERDLIDPDDGNYDPLLHSLIQALTIPSITPTPSQLNDELKWSITANLDDLDDPIDSGTSQRAPLTGNIKPSSSSSAPLNQSYLTSSIPGEDRRAPTNTIDESVWDTLSRDLRAVWEKMRQVLWPKYLLGGMLNRGEGIAGASREGLGGMWGAGRWPDADVVLQGGMSEGLRDWDLWHAELNDDDAGAHSSFASCFPYCSQ
ncbi:MAG: hypothetical protein M1825_003622 [Sarcosagium campestre]|nr:MAG: hypothetical protein M1825_003622 [Sarcosagium campestre]